MKRWILNWLGLGPKQEHSTGISAPYDSGRPRIIDTKHRNYFEVIDAVNGKIVVYTRNVYNSNGPDKNDMEVYLVHEGEDLMATITTAIVSAGLK
jgi:hypothetical protein